KMAKEGKVISINGKEISIKADSICVHGDNEKAIELVQNIRKALEGAGIEVRSLK
ncbi:MAG: LamB/YcsF family protein, partial [Anaerovibrio sp.]|nr:LamB/YcsF family protein [Anaerovibrio sp.]